MGYCTAISYSTLKGEYFTSLQLVHLILIASVDSIKLGKGLRYWIFGEEKEKKIHKSLHDFFLWSGYL